MYTQTKYSESRYKEELFDFRRENECIEQASGAILRERC